MLVGWRPRKEPMLQCKSEGHLLQNLLLLAGSQSFVLVRPSTNWLISTHIMEGSLLFSGLTSWNINLIQNSLTETSIMSDPTSGHHGKTKLRPKINHCAYSDQRLMGVMGSAKVGYPSFLLNAYITLCNTPGSRWIFSSPVLFSSQSLPPQT